MFNSYTLNLLQAIGRALEQDPLDRLDLVAPCSAAWALSLHSAPGFYIGVILGVYTGYIGVTLGLGFQRWGF